jgi:hypothetical protein
VVNGAEMNELAIQLSVINSQDFATRIIADIVSAGQKVKTYRARVFEQVKPATIKKMAEEIKTNIDRNLKQGLKYTGGAVAPLSKTTIEIKKAKGRANPARVFVDSGVLVKSLRVVPIARGYSITFQKYKYPKTKTFVSEVAQWLNDGTPKMPARPFFGITELQFNAIVNKYVGERRINVQPTQQQIERAGELISLITGENPLRIEVLKQPGGKLIQDINLEQLYQRSLGQ